MGDVNESDSVASSLDPNLFGPFHSEDLHVGDCIQFYDPIGVVGRDCDRRFGIVVGICPDSKFPLIL